MTTIYDPSHQAYLDEADLRAEMTRVYDLCHGCRLCFNLCPSFPTLFDFIDQRDGDVASMTVAEQDKVVDECYQCKLCFVKCPYVPPHEWALDFPRLMMRARAVRTSSGKRPSSEKLADQFLGRTDLIGRLSTLAAPVVNALTGTPSSLARRAMQATVGIAAERLLPPYARQRFTTWFAKNRHAGEPAHGATPQATATVFPTCFVEYMEPDIGKDVVRVLAHNGVACQVPQGTRCCGAPWLHSGNVEAFVAAARRNVAALSTDVAAGRDVIVAQPTCAYVLKKDYPLYLGTPAAEELAAHTFDPAEYLMRLRSGGETTLETDFDGTVPESVTYHVACHLQAQNIGLKSRDLLKLTGTAVNVVSRCSGIDGTWGYRKENYALARKVAAPLKRDIEAAGGEVVCGDCLLANGAILQETGRRAVHPIQIVARAYGLGDGGADGDNGGDGAGGEAAGES